MTRDDVIGWAREAGIEVHDRKQEARFGLDALIGADSTEKLQRMCERAAAAEREACAMVSETYPWIDGHRIPSNHAIARSIRARSTNT